jgi:hypothetical protein
MSGFLFTLVMLLSTISISAGRMQQVRGSTAKAIRWMPLPHKRHSPIAQQI